MSAWIYKLTEPGLWTVGFYDPDGTWHPESDHDDRQAAADRVHYLNGGSKATPLDRQAQVARRRLGQMPEAYR